MIPYRFEFLRDTMEEPVSRVGDGILLAVNYPRRAYNPPAETLDNCLHTEAYPEDRQSGIFFYNTECNSGVVRI